MKASFSILAHASSGLGARICEKKTNIYNIIDLRNQQITGNN